MEGNSIKTFENLCKIFEMRIRLDNAKGESVSPEIIEDYEKYATKIDTIYNEEFQSSLKNLISPRKTLEEERERLEKLISLLEDRLEKRSVLAGNFHKTTGKYIKNLQLIVSEKELNNKKERLSVISKYLDTTKETEDIKNSVQKLKEDLAEEETKKADYEEKNKTLEDELYSSFVTSIENDEYYGNIEEEKLDDLLVEVSKKAKESKETLDITKESISSLVSSGMDDEYESYIEEANKSYYLWKEREIVLSIYSLVINFEEEFNGLLKKREEINKLFDERKDIVLDKEDVLIPFENVMEKQSKILSDEKDILDNITNLTSRIDFKEERLEELEIVLKEPEVLAILDEFNLLPDIPEEPKEEVIPVFDIPNDEPIAKEINPYEIISIDNNPPTLNIGLAKLKGASVRDKVNKKLNPELNTSQNIINIDDNPSNFNNEENITEEIKEEPNIETESNIPTVTPINDIPVTDNVINKNTNIPDPVVLNEVPKSGTPVIDKTIPNLNTMDIPNESNSFWIPVSDSKLDQSQFPNINIPITNNNLNNGEDNLGFPNIEEDNNKGE